MKSPHFFSVDIMVDFAILANTRPRVLEDERPVHFSSGHRISFRIFAVVVAPTESFRPFFEGHLQDAHVKPSDRTAVIHNKRRSIWKS